jgi:hypothetical protein
LAYLRRCETRCSTRSSSESATRAYSTFSTEVGSSPICWTEALGRRDGVADLVGDARRQLVDARLLLGAHAGALAAQLALDGRVEEALPQAREPYTPMKWEKMPMPQPNAGHRNHGRSAWSSRLMKARKPITLR